MANDDKQLHGPAPDAESQVLEAGANLLQSFEPLKNVCAHLHAFHTPYHAPGSIAVPTSHFCAHPTRDVRQCLLYESNSAHARLLGVEYMVTAAVFAALPAAEKALWHSHVFEVKSGMLVMPQALADRGGGVPGVRAAWEAAETREMRQVVTLYGKVWQTWDVARCAEVPLGEPRLMTSFAAEGQMGDFEGVVGARDAELGTDWRRKKELRAAIEVPQIDPGADAAWREGRGEGH